MGAFAAAAAAESQSLMTERQRLPTNPQPLRSGRNLAPTRRAWGFGIRPHCVTRVGKEQKAATEDARFGPHFTTDISSAVESDFGRKSEVLARICVVGACC